MPLRTNSNTIFFSKNASGRYRAQCGISILFFFFFSLTLKHLQAQTIAYKQFTVENGLPSNSCYRIMQDHKGYINICTEKGIAVYDAYVFKKLNGIGQLPVQDVWGMLPDEEKRIWLLSNRKSYTFLHHDSAYNLNDILAPNINAQVILTAYKQAFIINKDTNDTKLYLLHANNKEYQAIEAQKLLSILRKNNFLILNIALHKRNIVCLTVGGNFVVYNIDSKSLQQRQFHQVKTFYYSKNHTCNIDLPFSFRAGDSIFALEGSTCRFLYTFKQINLPESAEIVGVATNYFWYKVDNKLFCTDKQFKPVQFTLPNIASGVMLIYEDREGNLWVNTKEEGIYFINKNAFKSSNYSSKSKLLYDQIISLAIDNKGKLYMGGIANKQLQYLQDGQIKSIHTETGRCYSIITFEDGTVVLPNKAIFQRTNNTIKEVPTNLAVKKICKVSETAFYTGGKDEFSLFIKTPNTIQLKRREQINGTVYGMCNTKQGLLLATTEGIYQFNNNQLTFLGSKNKSLTNYARDIQIDAQNNIWIANDQTGLECYSNLSQAPETITELKKSILSSICIDKFTNDIYVASADGLWKIYNIKFSPFRYQIKQLTTVNGLQSNEVNCVYADSLSLYVGTSEGLSILDKKPIENIFSSPLYCTELLINHQPVKIKENYALNYKQNNIQINLTTLSYQSNKKVSYTYRLGGPNSQWTTTKNQTIEFSDLEPGNYTFEAVANDVHQTPSKNKIKIHFQINPPFWKSWWFYILMAFLSLTVITYIIQARLKKIKLRELKEANIEKQIAEIKLEALQSQLNSHFIYNSLNAIQKFIIKNDVLSASEYMNRFANLIRGFLESSKFKEIELQKEIELLDTYLALQKLRFVDKFDYSVQVDKDVQLNTLYPSNLLQPFVENALIHGILNKNEKGFISVDFSFSNNTLRCKIEDDGIGRIEAEKLQKNIKTKRSLATAIISDRITIAENKKIQINFIDKNTQQQGLSGTIVIVDFTLD